MKFSEISKTKKIIAICLCLIAAIYIGFHSLNGMRPKAEFFAVRPYTAKDSHVFTGYIFREETVLSSSFGGMCRYYSYDGEKVAANEHIADVYLNGNEAVLARIADIKKQIEILRRSMSLGKLTLTEVEQKIELVSYEITQKTAVGNTSAANALGDELLVLMAKKDLLSSGKADYAAEITLLENQAAAFAAALGNPTETVLTPTSGYFYSETDGYEEIFTADIVDDMTVNLFEMLISSPPATETNAVGTLVTSAKWHYITKVPEKEAEGFLAGTTYDCLFSDNGYTEAIPMKLISKKTENGETLLTFFSSSLPRDFDRTRVQRMEAIRHAYEGFRIPCEVVRAENGITFVYVFDEGIAEKREVSILWEQNGYYIVNPNHVSAVGNRVLNLNDLILINDTSLYEGKFID